MYKFSKYWTRGGDVASGIKNFLLIDKDFVELTNLSRQPLFSLKDLGQPKTEVIKRFILDRRTDAEVETINIMATNLDKFETLTKVDIIVVAADYPSFAEIGAMVQDIAFNHNITVAFAGGYKANRGRVYPIMIPGKTLCFKCLVNYANNNKVIKGKRLANRSIVVSTNAQMGQFISSIVSSEILKYLSGVIEPYLINKYLSIDFYNYRIIEYKFEASEKCNHCNNILERVVE